MATKLGLRTRPVRRDESWNIDNDFSLWRCMVREFVEELLGESEDHGATRAPIDYDAWPFAARLTDALRSGQLRAYCLGLGVDPLTLATDVLTVAAFDAPLHDERFGHLVSASPEGTILSALPFERDVIDRYAERCPTQAAGAALLRLAWHHRRQLLG